MFGELVGIMLNELQTNWLQVKSTKLKLKTGYNPDLFEFFKKCNNQRVEEVESLG